MLNFKMWRPLRLLIYIFINLLFFSFSVFSQTPVWQWGKSIGGTLNNIPNSIAVDAAGNVYTTGLFSGTDTDFDPGPGVFTLFAYGAEDIFISKLDAAGNFVWAVAMGGLVNDNGNGIAVDAAGNVYVTGVFSGTVDFDPSGATTFNLSSNNFSTDIFVCKFNSVGNFVWAKAMGGPSNDNGYSLALDASANIYVTGFFSGTADFDPGAATFNLTTGGYNDIFVSKLDSAGNFVWAKSMAGTTYAYGQSIAVDASQNVYVTGSFSTTVDFDPGAATVNLTSAGNYDPFVLRLDNAGNFVWAKSFAGTSLENSFSIAVDGNGNVFTCGLFWAATDFDPGAATFNITPVGGPDIWISKLNSSGDFVWAKAMGGLAQDEAHGLTLDATGNVYITGIFNSTADFDPGIGTFNLIDAGGGDIFLCQLDASGNFGWAMQTSGDAADLGTSVALSPAGNLYVTGFFFSHVLTAASSLANADTSATTNDIVIAKTSTIPTGNSSIENASDGVSIFPNPVANALIVRGSGFGDINEIVILNTLGEKVFQFHISSLISHISVDVSQLPTGIYFIKLKSSAKIQTVKFLKE